MGIEEGTFWDEHWVLYGNQFDNKLHILKKKKSKCRYLMYILKGIQKCFVPRKKNFLIPCVMNLYFLIYT